MEELNGCMFAAPGEIHGMSQDQFGVTLERMKYSNKKWKNPHDLVGFFYSHSTPSIPKPENSPRNASMTDQAMWEAEVKS